MARRRTVPPADPVGTNDQRFVHHDAFRKRRLVDWIIDAHACSRRVSDQLDDEQLLGPQRDDVNPPLWEIGHLAWFYERWVLRHAAGVAPVLEESGKFHNSMTVDHDIRWEAHLPDRKRAYAYADAVRDRVVEVLESRPDDPRIAYHAFYALLHEDMHLEAFAYSRQSLAWCAPALTETVEGADLAAEARNRENAVIETDDGHGTDGDVELAGGLFRLGAELDSPFVFDNEKWAHTVEVAPFAISRIPVTESELAAFVDDGGYRDRRWWSEDGWAWRTREEAAHPIYWRHDGRRWHCRVFDAWRPIDPSLPAVHVSYFEAEAYCRWAGRRLPTEAEWELAASAEPAGNADDASRRFPWGGEAALVSRANVDGEHGGVAPVVAWAAGDSAGGVRQLIGNVWEWTSSVFEPFPGFEADRYADFSQPWFGGRRVLRGGSWASRGRMIRNTLRNFFPPDRRDIFAGFRTCSC